MSTKLDQLLLILYRDMHARGYFAGKAWRACEARFRAFLAAHPTVAGPILDYGCGPAGGLSVAFDSVIPYDPYVPEFARDPWDRDPGALFSSDVFEHLPVHQLRAVVKRAGACPSLTGLFLNVSTRAANRVMPNGMNAHLTVRPAAWWQGFFEFELGERFDCVTAEADLFTESAVFGFVRRQEGGK